MKNTKSWRNKIVAAAVIVALFTGATAVPGVSPLDIFPVLSAYAEGDEVPEFDGTNCRFVSKGTFTIAFVEDDGRLKMQLTGGSTKFNGQSGMKRSWF
jgi:hypothetical protein